MPQLRLLRTNPGRLALSSPWRLLVPCLLLLPYLAHADAEQEARYPYDPACAWGRIANGQGMLHRCISKDEAQSLLQQSPSELAATGTLPTAPPEPEVKEAPPRAFTLTVGPIEAEEGEMTVGALDKPVDRYRSCIEENGGLEAAQGKIIVRFLVRAERGRAEGTELDSFEGVSKKAAQCVASVVDRRRVGTPSVPLTGTRLTFSLQEKR